MPGSIFGSPEEEDVDFDQWLNWEEDSPTESTNVSSLLEGSSDGSSMNGSTIPTSGVSTVSRLDQDRTPHNSPRAVAGGVGSVDGPVDKLLIPPLSNSQLNREHTIAFHTSSPGESVAGFPPGPHTLAASPVMPHSSPPSPGESPLRVVKDPKKTAEMRKIKACMPCKIARTRCNDDTVCSNCVKASEKLNDGSASDTCIRDDFVNVLGSQHNRWRAALPQFPIPKAGPTQDMHYGIPVQVLDLPMLEWAREQRRWDKRTDFASQVEHLLVEFASNDILGGIARSENLAEAKRLEISRQNELMRKLADMSAIWKIWSAKEFFIRTASNPDRVVPMKVSFEYAQTHLKMCAGTILSRLEGEVLQGVNNNYLKHPNIKKKDSPRFWAAMNVAMWLSMTQLILMYRETEYLSIVQPQTYAPGMDTGSSKFAFYGTTSELLRRLIVVYSSQARTSSVLQALNKVEEEAFGNYPETYSKFQKAWDGRRSFYRDIQIQIFPSDKLIHDLIVKKEEMVFKRKRDKDE